MEQNKFFFPRHAFAYTISETKFTVWKGWGYTNHKLEHSTKNNPELTIEKDINIA